MAGVIHLLTSLRSQGKLQPRQFLNLLVVDIGLCRMLGTQHVHALLCIHGNPQEKKKCRVLVKSQVSNLDRELMFLNKYVYLQPKTKKPTNPIVMAFY